MAEGAAVPGQGLFIEALSDGLSRRVIRVPVEEVELVVSSPSQADG
jgi:hypothetical protein